MERLAISSRLALEFNRHDQVHAGELEHGRCVIQERAAIHCDEVRKTCLRCVKDMQRVGRIW